MAEANSNVGSASHLGENQVLHDSHFVYDYSRRRVPLPIVSYMAVADAAGDVPVGENPAKKALDMLRDLIEPAVIAEEELETGQMEGLIRGALSTINAALVPAADAQPGTGAQVSLTVVVADTRRAYIGHVGNTRVYLLHNDRLYDLVPSGATSSTEPPAPPPEVAPTLFAVADEAAPAGGAAPPSAEAQAAPEQTFAAPTQPQSPPPAGIGSFLGQSAEVGIGFNQVDIVTGDTIILCTDGLWRPITEEELVENLLTAMSVQRSANQLVRLAFSRDASDNATMVAWQYGEEEEVAAVAATGRRADKRKGRARTRAAEGLLVALLALVLVGIFAVGFAFGWRITDTFRKPAKEAAKKANAQKAAEEKKAEGEGAAEQSAPSAQSSAPAASFPQSATVTGQGVRMRATPDTNGELIGLLRDGQQVTVLGEAMGTDSKTWSRVKATVKSEGQDKEAEGYVRNDFLKVSPQSSAP